MNEQLTTAKTRLLNAKARLLEIEIAEREKTLRSSDECWQHIFRFGAAMQNVRITSIAERNIWLEEIDKQMKLSKELLQEQNL